MLMTQYLRKHLGTLSKHIIPHSGILSSGGENEEIFVFRLRYVKCVKFSGSVVYSNNNETSGRYSKNDYTVFHAKTGLKS